MNVVPVSGFNTLPVIYDRGLIGVMHDWYRQCALNSSFYILLPTSYMLGDFVAYIQILFSLIHKIFEATILDHESYGHIKCIPCETAVKVKCETLQLKLYACCA